MNLATTAVFYAVIGAAVATALAISTPDGTRTERFLRVLAAWAFWPLYLPLLLQPRPTATQALPPSPANDLDAAIAQVERELESAWKSLDGWAEEALSREAERVAELRSAWRTQAARLRELDELLAQQAVTSEEWLTRADDLSDRVRHSTAARSENLDRLRSLRRQMADDLLGTLAWVRELVTMIHLAKYTGAPASRADELVSQIAAAVEGISEVHHWQDRERESCQSFRGEGAGSAA
jgi:chromosome segregation ATPase